MEEGTICFELQKQGWTFDPQMGGTVEGGHFRSMLNLGTLPSSASSVSMQAFITEGSSTMVSPVVVDAFTYLPSTSSLLRLRFAELYPVVDAFLVLVGSHTHDGAPILPGSPPLPGGGDWWGYGGKVRVVHVDLSSTTGTGGGEGAAVREEMQRDATTEAVEEYGAYATTLDNLKLWTPTSLRRWMRSTARPPMPLPCIELDAGWHLSTFGPPQELVRKVRHTCCEHEKFRGSKVFEDEDKMGRIARGGRHLYDLNGDKEFMAVRRWEGEGHPIAVEECERGADEECEWIEEFFLKPLTEAEKYELDQDILRASFELTQDFAMDYRTKNGPEGRDGHHLLEVECSRGNPGQEEVEMFDREEVGGGLGAENKQKLIDTMAHSCMKQGGVGVATEKVVLDSDAHREIIYDGRTYFIKLTAADDPVEVARYHCIGIGMNDEQCRILEDEMKTWFK
ncbi:hypothetical protein TrRE_jg11579 [Triparma retinervis]|uniref:Uncharacterized protein n=1 Tax=Triparma retinervis TaxID=2557542 RepID=A0A9W7A0J8_9STRA|nr:hypothetical protein TrRE_jg11579 [Triparma retinervis]